MTFFNFFLISLWLSLPAWVPNHWSNKIRIHTVWTWTYITDRCSCQLACLGCCAVYQIFETYIPRKETARPRFQFLHSSGSNLYTVFPWSVLFGISIFLYCKIELSAQQSQEDGRAGNCRQAAVGGSSTIWKIMEHKWKHIILVANLLLGLKLNEIPNRNFYWIFTGPSFAVCINLELRF